MGFPKWCSADKKRGQLLKQQVWRATWGHRALSYSRAVRSPRHASRGIDSLISGQLQISILQPETNAADTRYDAPSRQTTREARETWNLHSVCEARVLTESKRSTTCSARRLRSESQRISS